MGVTVLRESDLLQQLRQECARHGSDKAAAQALGVSQSYLSTVLRGRRPIGGGLALTLGYTRQACFVPAEEGH